MEVLKESPVLDWRVNERFAELKDYRCYRRPLTLLKLLTVIMSQTPDIIRYYKTDIIIFVTAFSTFATDRCDGRGIVLSGCPSVLAFVLL